MTDTQNEILASLGLNVDKLANPGKYIRTIREGISGDVVKRAVKIFDNRELIVRILGTTSSNLSRYYRVKKMNRGDSEEILDTIRFYNQAMNVFGNLEKTRTWIKTSTPALAGEKPEALLDTFEGRKWVSQVLRKIEYGEFV